MTAAAPEDKSGPESIIFGLDRATDERSLMIFLRLFSQSALLQALVPRLDDAELTGLLDHLTDLMRKHLSEMEYHRLFLAEDHDEPSPSQHG